MACRGCQQRRDQLREAAQATLRRDFRTGLERLGAMQRSAREDAIQAANRTREALARQLRIGRRP